MRTAPSRESICLYRSGDRRVGETRSWAAVRRCGVSTAEGTRGKIAVDQFEEPECRVPDFPGVDDVGFRIPFRRGGCRWATQYGGFSGLVCPAYHIANALPLDMHAGGKHRVRPAHIVFGSRLIVLVDEPDLPFFRHKSRNEQDALWRHERFDRRRQREGVIERSKRRSHIWGTHTVSGECVRA